jgi:hypothetical protein
VHLVGFTVEMYHDAPFYKRQMCRVVACVPHYQWRAASYIPSFKLRDKIEQAASLSVKTRILYKDLEGSFEHETSILSSMKIRKILE